MTPREFRIFVDQANELLVRAQRLAVRAGFVLFAGLMLGFVAGMLAIVVHFARIVSGEGKRMREKKERSGGKGKHGAVRIFFLSVVVVVVAGSFTKYPIQPNNGPLPV